MCMCVCVVHLHCAAQLSNFNMEKRYRNIIIIIYYYEDRLAHLPVCWRWTPGSPETACRL